ncbi:MAG: uracil-DNA glycosylase [Treponema sp.]|jgi:DNA polymerase|nr:uracil-DNA glycosylase [Treponema sp.]
MTADEKTSLAEFLDAAAAVTGSGYRSAREYHFSDDVVNSSSETAADADAPDSLEKVAAAVRSCTACKLAATRKNAVPGEGVLNPLVMVIGEGPGADEDATGRPFVGRAGQLLDKMLAAIGLSRESNCFIANVIKCRPPANRDPQPDETAACASFLERQIQIIKPRCILCAGRIAAHTLLNTTEPIGRLRGKFIDFQAGDITIPFLATYHPSALLRNEDLKRPAWEDLKLLRGAIEETAH